MAAADARPAAIQLDNGLRIGRVPIQGTRAITVLVAFEAGARTESAQENGIAHFLEHLVFKGGHDYPTHREINEAGERIGARVDAWTSHDIVVFRVRSRAEAAAEAINLLTDFVARPALDPGELERERGVVIQEIARSMDRPTDRADELIEVAAFGDHPLGRPVLGTEERLRAFSREDVVRFRERRWSGERGCVLLVGNLGYLPAEHRLIELFGRFPDVPPPEPYEPAPPVAHQIIVEERDSSQSHLRLMYRPEIDFRGRAMRAALVVYRTVLGGSQGSVLFDELRERRGLAYSTYALEHVGGDGVLVQVVAGLDSEKCVEAYRLIRELVARMAVDGPDQDHVDRARSYAAGRRVLAFENTNVLADHLAESVILHGEETGPEDEITGLDAVTYEQVAEVASKLADAPAVACVGPQTTADFA